MQVNYFSVARMLEAVIPQMIQHGSGRIVAVSSLAAYRGMPGSGAYNASKAAVTTLIESVRLELRGSGITVTTIAPGFVRTDMTAKNDFVMPSSWNRMPQPAGSFTPSTEDARSTGSPWRPRLPSTSFSGSPTPSMTGW